VSRPTPLRELPPLNTNYSPPRPWVCCAHVAHECAGPVVGALGATPVCAAAVAPWLAEQAADHERWERYAASPKGRAEAAAERAWESRVS
jgi:hypothetical protein